MDVALFISQLLQPQYRAASGHGQLSTATTSPPDPTTERSITAAPQKVEQDFTFTVGDVVVRMIYIPPTSFMMGSPKSENGRRWLFDDYEGPQRRVTLTKGFWLAETQVTQELWKAVDAGENPSTFKGIHRPVDGVSWIECQQFIEKLNAHVPSLHARLPTEAEWECAARAGTITSRYGELDDVAWYGKNSCSETTRVAWKKPNAWGLYDMLGNVWEWTGDCFGAYSPHAVIDPSNQAGAYRVARGGAWNSKARYCRAASRHGHEPDYRSHTLGLRLARGHDEPDIVWPDYTLIEDIPF